MVRNARTRNAKYQKNKKRVKRSPYGLVIDKTEKTKQEMQLPKTMLRTGALSPPVGPPRPGDNGRNLV